ncbi:MAG: diguanylate cyclase [Xanthomonadaceae bacterium]|nr:diguanylate cyclase [Xanthomonadaceae bacterium]
MGIQWVDEQLLRTMADLVPCGLLVLSADGAVELWNRQLQQMTGLDASQVKSQPWAEIATKILADGGEPLENLTQAEPPVVFSEVQHVGRQCEMITADEDLIPVDILFFPVSFSSGSGRDDAGSSLVGIFSWSGVDDMADGELLSAHGQVSGIPSQYELSFMMPQQLALLARYNIPFTMLFLELKNCQLLIDSLGLDAWNSTLRAIYGSLQSIVRRADFVGGYDHATFWLMLANATVDGSQRVAEKMLLHASRITVENADVTLSAVVGGAIARTGETPDAFFTRSYGALQQAHQVPEGIFIDQ